MRRAFPFFLVLVGCASLRAASEHTTQLAIGSGVGLGVGLLSGGVLLPVLAAAAAASVATIFSTPPCPAQTIIHTDGGSVTTGAGHGVPLVDWVLGAAVLYFAWRNRSHLADILRGRASGRILRTLKHTLVGGQDPRKATP